MSTQGYIRSITELSPDEFPTLTPLPEGNSGSSFFTNVSWQTWLIVFLILTLLGINVFAYLAKGTEETASIFRQVFGPILSFFGFGTLHASKQVIETSAKGAKAGVDIVAGATTGALDIVEETAKNGIPAATSGTSIGLSTPEGRQAGSSMPSRQQVGEEERWQPGALEMALEDASLKQNQQGGGPIPHDSSFTTGKAGWCFIGEDQEIRSCSEIGVNDKCMSGDVFPTQAVCMNPNLRV